MNSILLYPLSLLYVIFFQRILPRKTSVPANINSSIQPAQMRRQGSLNLGVQASFSPVGSPPDVVTPTTPGYSYFSGQEAGRGTLARDRNTLYDLSPFNTNTSSD
eukprot:m.51521 g.51521  ORF g.51521 m.51521 type:complete len:105 (+) comp34155_c0_seq9:855-1169(+)